MCKKKDADGRFVKDTGHKGEKRGRGLICEWFDREFAAESEEQREERKSTAEKAVRYARNAAKKPKTA